MDSELKPCPCGKTPIGLCIQGGDGSKWAWVSGDCCGEWSIEFRTEYLAPDSKGIQALARHAWNDAPRAAEDRLRKALEEAEDLSLAVKKWVEQEAGYKIGRGRIIGWAEKVRSIARTALKGED